jgi:hypothetical protein
MIAAATESNTTAGAIEFGSFSPRIVATDFCSPSSPSSLIVFCSAVTADAGNRRLPGGVILE